MFLAQLRGFAYGNVLAIGDRAMSAEPIEVPINPLGDLNFKSRADILAWRTQYLYKSPALLSGPYSPLPEIFDQIEDNRPWWGVHGAFVWGAGQKSIEGPAEESRFILNPLLLVGANPNSAEIWNQEAITQEDLADPSFPFCWLAKSLKWYPNQALVQATYDVTAFNKDLEARKSKLTASPSDVNRFGLIAYNARDFGFNYIYLDTKKSINVTADESNNDPVQIVQMIHCGGTCQYPGGCNNMSPAMPAIDYFRFSELPARANIRLWRNRPGSTDEKPDLTYLLDFR
jgi:hypothetical protein